MYPTPSRGYCFTIPHLPTPRKSQNVSKRERCSCFGASPFATPKVIQEPALNIKLIYYCFILIYDKGFIRFCVLNFFWLTFIANSLEPVCTIPHFTHTAIPHTIASTFSYHTIIIVGECRLG